MVAIADSNGFDTYIILSIYLKNPEQLTKNSLFIFVGVVCWESFVLAVITFEGLTKVNLPKGDAVYSDFILRNKKRHPVGPIVNYPAQFEVSSEKIWELVIDFEFLTRDFTRYLLQNGDINKLSTLPWDLKWISV